MILAITPIFRSSPKAFRHALKVLSLLCHSLLLMMVLSLWNNCQALDSDVVFTEREMQVTAGYLYHFTKFTTWPIALPVIHTCVFEDPDFTEILREAYNEKTDIDVNNINAKSDITLCQLIIFSKNPPADYLKRLSKFAILTVGLQKNFIELGGIIYLYEKNEKLRFIINNTAATAARLQLSSQLLQLSGKP